MSSPECAALPLTTGTRALWIFSKTWGSGEKITSRGNVCQPVSAALGGKAFRYLDTAGLLIGAGISVQREKNRNQIHNLTGCSSQVNMPNCICVTNQRHAHTVSVMRRISKAPHTHPSPSATDNDVGADAVTHLRAASCAINSRTEPAAVTWSACIVLAPFPSIPVTYCRRYNESLQNSAAEDLTVSIV